MSKNVLTLSHLYPSPDFPGWGPFVRDEVVELARRNGMAVVSPVPWRRRQLSPRVAVETGIRVARPRIPPLPLGGLLLESRLWAYRLRPLLREMYQEIDGDLIHAHFALPDGFAAASYTARAHVPLVLTIWGSDIMQFGSRRSLRASLRRTFDEARAIIAVSEELAERAGSIGASAGRLRVIPGGVPFQPPLQQADARQRVGVVSDAVCVLWVGGFVPVKQPLQAVAAFEDFTAAGAAAALLVMIGDGPLTRDVRQLVRRKGLNVKLVGFKPREEIWRWHCAADVLLNSSRTEGTPLTVLEALGAGTPVVAYPLGGIARAVDSVAGGTLALEKTPRALAGALAAELATERDRGQLAERARAQFDIARTGRDIQAVYEAVT